MTKLISKQSLFIVQGEPQQVKSQK